MVTMRMPADLIANIEGWAAGQLDGPTRSEAIRRLVELGLTVKTKAKQPAPSRAKELATKADRKDYRSPLEERAQRRRRLTKGPSEFRDEVDLPKAKGK